MFMYLLLTCYPIILNSSVVLQLVQLPSKRVPLYSQSTQREENIQLVAENKIIFIATMCLTFPNSNNL